jgi:DNA-binding MarR family transcriptional regulator
VTSRPDSPGLMLWVVTLRWQRRMAATLAPLDLTHVQFVLLASAWWLGEHEGAPQQQRLAEHAGTDVKMTSQVLKTLVAKGLVERRADAEDARAKRVHVTAAGRELAPRAMTAVEAADRDFFAVAPSADVLRVLRALAEDAR